MRVSPENSSARRERVLPAAMLVFVLAVASPSDAQEPANGATATRSAAGVRDNDFLYHIQQAKVTPHSGEAHGVLLNVDGSVVANDGQLVAGAVVCLLEDSQLRSRSQSGEPRFVPDQTPVRGPNVLARTTTDANGRYAFASIKTPTSDGAISKNWKGYIVAAHPTLGVGWSVLQPKSDELRTETAVTVHLKKFADISGIYQGTDGQPIADAELSLYAIDEAVVSMESRLSGHPGLHLSGSQIMPVCRTNMKGEYRFRNLPTGFAAIVLAPADSQYLSSLAAIATDPAMRPGSRGELGRPEELLRTNSIFKANIGVRIRGEVKDEDGRPVSEVLVARPFYGSTRTDAQGKFELRLPPGDTSAFLTTAKHRLPSYEIDFTPNSSTGLLPRSEYVGINSQNQIMIKPDVFVDSIEIRLTKGVRVIGKVEDTDGKPIKDVKVQELSVSIPIRKPGEPEPPKVVPQQRPLPHATTGDEGTFELLLTPYVHTLYFSCGSPGYQLPESVQFINNPQERLALPHIVVDVQNGQPVALQPLRVKRVPPIDVRVLLPDGKPAAGAEVVLWEHSAEQMIEFFESPNNREISQHMLTDAQGEAQLQSVGQPSIRATVKASLRQNGSMLVGETTLSRVPRQRTVVQLIPEQIPGIRIIPVR